MLPGPPNECKPLFDSECLPRLRETVPPRHIAKRTLRAHDDLAAAGMLARGLAKELAELNQSLGIHGAFQNHAGTRVGIGGKAEMERLEPAGAELDPDHAVADPAVAERLVAGLVAALG